MWFHLCSDVVPSLRLNPKAFWTYAAEDMIGRIKRLAKKCHRASLCQSLVERYLVGKSLQLADLLH